MSQLLPTRPVDFQGKIIFKVQEIHFHTYIGGNKMHQHASNKVLVESSLKHSVCQFLELPEIYHSCTLHSVIEQQHKRDPKRDIIPMYNLAKVLAKSNNLPFRCGFKTHHVT